MTLEARRPMTGSHPRKCWLRAHSGLTALRWDVRNKESIRVEREILHLFHGQLVVKAGVR